ncbi:hypothetical protein, partial [Mycobacterium sp. 4858]|uniref:ESX-1 associated ATP-binding protein EpsI N-terminal domain-containing protein n=1 Tax=Mycobacterium sp. 4858 TaxID=2057185 RepID=UPI001E353A41
MAADYDRLFPPSDEADAAQDAGGYGDFDVDGPSPTPPGPPNTPPALIHNSEPPRGALLLYVALCLRKKLLERRHGVVRLFGGIVARR